MTNTLLIDVFQVIVLLYSVVLHELSHGLMARALGDHTAEDMGRLTLNPLKHLDLFGSIILPLLSLLTAGLMFGYAKPVPYNPDNLNDRKYGPSKVAIAGPLTNVALAVAAGLVIRLGGGVLSQTALELIGYIVWINIVLALFNLMPIPPLDGHWLLMTVLPARWYQVKVFLYRYQWVLVVGFIFFIFPLLYPVIAGIFTLLTGIHLSS